MDYFDIEEFILTKRKCYRVELSLSKKDILVKRFPFHDEESKKDARVEAERFVYARMALVKDNTHHIRESVTTSSNGLSYLYLQYRLKKKLVKTKCVGRLINNTESSRKTLRNTSRYIEAMKSLMRERDQC